MSTGLSGLDLCPTLNQLDQVGWTFPNLPPIGKGVGLDWSSLQWMVIGLYQVRNEEIWPKLAKFGEI